MIAPKKPAQFWEDLEWGSSPMLGSTGFVSSDKTEKDVIERLHDVVEEVTGVRPKRAARKLGFL